MKNDHARIIELRIRNIGPIEALDITPKGSVVEVRGPNAAGKTTALNALSYLLEGARTLPDVPIREGANKSEIVGTIQTADGILVFKRVCRKKSTDFTVTRADGTPVGSPQKVADALIGHRTVRAQAFSELSASDQKSVLAEVAGIDLNPLHREYDEVFAKRTVVNRDVDRLEKQVVAIPADADVGTELRDVAALSGELTAAHEQREKNRVKASAKEDAIRVYAAIDARIRELEEQIDTLEPVRDKAHKIMVDAEDTAVGLVDPDTSVIGQKIAEADTYNERVRAQQRRAELAKDERTVTAQADALTDRLQAIKGEISRVIREAPMPIKGLKYTPDGVTFNGLPFEQASGTEQDLVSVAIACNRAGPLKAITFDNGESMDNAHRKKLYRMVNDAGLLALVAIVDDSNGDGGVRIVEGMPEERAT